jgi:hypothetical protein
VSADFSGTFKVTGVAAKDMWIDVGLQQRAVPAWSLTGLVGEHEKLGARATEFAEWPYREVSGISWGKRGGTPRARRQMARRGAGDRLVGLGLLPHSSARNPAEVLDDQVAGDAGDESRQALRLAHYSSPDFFQNQTKGILGYLILLRFCDYFC